MIKIIAAMSNNGCIGQKGALPWHLPPDLDFFKEMTKGQIVLMGRRTWDSLPVKPLPSRKNVIISRDLNLPEYPNVRIFRNINYALPVMENLSLETQQDIYLIGGSTIFRQAFAGTYVKEMLLTTVDMWCPGDAFFPEVKKDDWNIDKILEGHYKDLKFEINRWIRK